MKYLNKALQKVYTRSSFIGLTVALFGFFALLNYLLLTKTTTWEKFMSDNPTWFIFLSINLSILNIILLAVVLTMVFFVLDEKKKFDRQTGSSTLAGTFLSLVSIGCTVCGGFLLPLVGIAASLSAFPFQGLEIKVFSIAVLAFTLLELGKRVEGIFPKKHPQTNIFNKYPLVIISLLFVIIVYGIPRLPTKIKQKIGIKTQSASTQSTSTTTGAEDEIFNEINPKEGYEINATYGNLGPQMVASGVIDYDKFKETYEKNGQPLTQEQVDILTKGTDKKVKITRENSYFLLNFFWAAGLINKTRILTEGDMVKYGDGQAGNFASTGGWTLTKSGNPMDYYSNQALISLTQEQENLVEKVASNIYRPCCGNSTAFPDCNHGMALLAVLELMVSQGANEDELYKGAKYINAFFFPGNYYDLAVYFKNKEGKSFKDIDGRVILAKEYSSSQGWQKTKQWLSEKGIIKEPPKQGGGCGV